MSSYQCTVPWAPSDIRHTRQAISYTKLDRHDLGRRSYRKKVPDARDEDKHECVLPNTIPSINQTDIGIKYSFLRRRLGGQTRSNNPTAGFHGT
jgi:hypothetical protein